MNDVSVYIGRQRKWGEGSLIERTSLRPFLVLSVPSAGVSNIHQVKNTLLLVRNEECMREMHPFDRGPFPPLSKGRH